MAGQEDPVQREIHQDWANREYIEVITSSIKKIADFLNSFGKTVTARFMDKSPLSIIFGDDGYAMLVPLAVLLVHGCHSQLALSLAVRLSMFTRRNTTDAYHQC